MNLSNKNSRLQAKLGKLYTTPLGKGIHLAYRRSKRGGTWVGKWKIPGEGFQYVYERLGDDIEWSSSLNSLNYEDAIGKAKEFALRKRQEESGEIVGGLYTIADAMNDYIADRARELKCKPDDKKLARAQAIIRAHILPTFKAIQLAKLNHVTVKKWRDSLADAAPRLRTRKGKQQVFRTVDHNDPDAVRARQASTNRILTVLKAGLNHAKAQKRIDNDRAWIDVKPFTRVDVAKIRFLSNTEVPALASACAADFQSLVKGALLTGCRYGELTAMTVADFNEKDGNVYVAQSKNGESRHVDLNAAGIRFFRELVDGRKPTEKIFLRANGKPWKQSEQQRPMNAACEAAGVEDVTFHILRHTYASHALMNGMTIEILAQQLGHKDTRITLRHYAHLCPTFKAESVRRNAPSFGFAGASEPAGSPSPARKASSRRTGKLLRMASA